MVQQNINGKEADDDKKDAETKLPQETLVKLEGLGFTESKDEEKKGLFWKDIGDGNTFFRDFRPSSKKEYYVTTEDGLFLPDEDVMAMEEYIVLHQKAGRKEEPEKKPKGKKEIKPEDKKEEIPIIAVIDKKTGKPLMIENEGDAYTIMNIKDDEQVRQEIMGNYLSEFVYQFEVTADKKTRRKRKITGLSWAGVKEVARKQGNISVEDIKVSETEKTYRVQAKVKDIARNVTMFGVAEQSKTMRLKSGEDVEDLHALSKAFSRAQRNGIRALIPEMIIKAVIEEYLKEEASSG